MIDVQKTYTYSEIVSLIRDDKYSDIYLLTVENKQADEYRIYEYRYASDSKVYSSELKKGYMFSNSFIMLPTLSNELLIDKSKGERIVLFSKNINESRYRNSYLVEAEKWMYCVPVVFERIVGYIDVFAIAKELDDAFDGNLNMTNVNLCYGGSEGVANLSNEELVFCSWSENCFPVTVTLEQGNSSLDNRLTKNINKYILVSNSYNEWVHFRRHNDLTRKSFSMLSNGVILKFNSDRQIRRNYYCGKNEAICDIEETILFDSMELNEGLYCEFDMDSRNDGSLYRIIQVY